MTPDPQARYGVIGGSGLYALAGFEPLREVRLDTPFGPPSDVFRIGRIGERTVAFLARHGDGHSRIPGQINYQANIFGFKLLGVERLLSASAVGSMRESVRPRDVVLVDQFIDRTQGRKSTFFDGGLAAHIGFADPICSESRQVLLEAARDASVTAHDGGTYLCMEGPAFSTRAESRLYRSWDVDVIGMTNVQEAKLAREAEICYATLALVTDYDCWHEEEDDVSVHNVLDNLRANSQVAGKVVHAAIEAFPERGDACGCASALRHAIITLPDAVAPEALERLRPIVGKYLGGDTP